MAEPQKASIVILTYNNLDYTRMCVESIFDRTIYPNYEIILVDNASHDETPQYLKELAESHSNVRIILNETNEGFARGNNLGADDATGEYLVFLNNDTVVTDGWLSGLVGHLQDPRVGLIGPVTNSSGNESRIEVDYDGLEGMDEFAQQYTEAHRGETFEIDMLAFLCIAMRRQVYEEVGPLDELFGVGMFEDDDYALRVKQRGYRIICAEDVYVHHWGGASFSRLGQVAYRKLFEENRKKFEEKWGMEWQPHLYRRELLRKQVGEMVEGAAWLTMQIEERDRKIAEQQAIINRHVNTLMDIYASTSWGLVQKLWKIRSIIAPASSRRERLLFTLWRIQRAAFRLRVQNPFQMTWYAYLFDRFKRARHRFATPRLSSLQCPSEKDLVSIVLPVYNGEDYLRESLESVLAQTYPHFELIVVDDGSTDETPEIIQEFVKRDPRVQAIRQANQRLPRALSNGFKQARGKYLTWTSADNRMKPVFLERLVDCLQRHPDWDMVYANVDIIDERGQPLVHSHWYKGYQRPPGSEHIELPQDPSVLNTYANNYVGKAFMYRDRVDFLLGDYSPYRFDTEDYDYWMRVNGALQLRHADFHEQIYEYRFHPSSLTSQDNALGITRSRDRLLVFEEFRRDFHLSPLAWKVDDSGEPGASLVAQKIRQWAREANHTLLDDAAYYPDETPRLWFPDVHVKVVEAVPEPLDTPPDGSPHALNILVVSGTENLPDEVDPGWHLCITSKARSELPHLPSPRQGWLVIPDVGVMCTAIDIRARSFHLAALEAEIESPHPPSCKISVVLCTYHRGDLLLKSMHSVAQQTFPAKDYELIVVNNDPADQSVDEMVAQLHSTDFEDRHDHLKLIKCPLKGLSFARNAGISEALGEVICFLDDDAIAQPDWLEHVWRAFERNPQAGLVGGKILLEAPEHARTWIEAGWGRFWSEFNPKYDEITKIQHWMKFPWGANWCARKGALLQIGGFRGNYGRKGSDFGGGEELVAALLIQRLGYEIVINPSAVVLHTPDSERFTIKHVRRTIISGMYSNYRLQIDLYLSLGLKLSFLVLRVLKSFVRAISKRNPYQRIEHLMHAQAGVRLVGLNLQDYLARYRRPFARKKF